MKNFKFIYLVIFLFLFSCGYSPIYTSSDNKDFNIKIINTNGNNEINNLFLKKLEVYKNENSDKDFNIIINSFYNKKILSKNEKGDATNYRLILEVKINTNINNENINLNYRETFDMKKQAEIFEEERYEKLIKNNMITSIVRKLLSTLSQQK
ncbi:hypothetical protein [Candidatus Pelagibacter sp. HIMB1493]|uniref:hypothetical protein n=1 Tax=Candidatus Pelagibacter sp. HIMB1493 TaxID=3413334 RepID=UPI003F867DEF